MRNTVLTILCTITVSVGAANGADTFVSFDYPGAASTTAMGINADGMVVGSYVDNTGKQHGFLLSGGQFSSIDYPGALSTDARGINSQGDIVGVHVDVAGLPGGGDHGYLLQQGNFTNLDYPGHLNTITQRINDDGQIVGCYHDTDTMGTMFGMLMSSGNFSAVSMQASMSNGVLPGAGLIAGFYTDMMSGIQHAFLASNGNIASFDFPFSTATGVWDMNPSAEVVGNYIDAAKRTHGYFLHPDDAIATFGINPQLGVSGTFTFASIDYPGASLTRAYGINIHGDIVGNYVDSAGKTHAYLLSRGRHHQN